jgi:hypothetical protein
VVADFEVFRLVVLLGAQRHARAVGHNGLLRQLLALQQHRERLLAAVLFVDFLNLNSIVTEEVV